MRSSHAVALVLGVAGLGTACGGDGMVRRTPTGSCADLTCSFTDLSADGDGTVVGYHWDFGDGAEAATQNATHAYAPAGNYVVELTVTGDSGATSSLSQQVTVTGSLTGRAESTRLSLFDLVSRVPG
jgi:microbial collagenase